MESIKCTIRFLPEDLQKAYMIHYKKNHPVRRLIIPIIAVILIVLAVFLLIITYTGESVHYLAWIFIGYAIVFMGIYIWKMKTLGKRMYKKIHEFKQTFEYEFSEKGIGTKCEGLVSSVVAWGYYNEAVIDKEILLLFPNKFKFNFFHKRYFTDEEFDQLKKWITGNIGNIKYN